MRAGKYHERDPPYNSCVVVAILVAFSELERSLQSALPEDWVLCRRNCRHSGGSLLREAGRSDGRRLTVPPSPTTIAASMPTSSFRDPPSASPRGSAVDGAPAAPDELTIDEAREILEGHVRTTTWGWRGLSKRLPIESFERSGAFDVIFSSFTETRGTRMTHRPYRGGDIDGPDRGQAPGPWEIPIALPGTFIDEERVLTVPHTEVVKTCYTCNGQGIVTCSRCGGSGRNQCSSCGGRGRVSKTRTVTETDYQGNSRTRTESYTETCSTCDGDGQVTCGTCAGSGRVTCGTCDGCCRIVHYQELHVRWATRTNSTQIEGTGLPDELIGFAEGIAVLLEEEAVIEQGRGAEGGGPYRGGNVRVNAAVEAAANELIARHTFAAGDKLHLQRLIVRAVPVYEGRYRFRKEERSFWIYGTDRNVHAPRYPLSPLRVGAAAGGGVAGTVGIVLSLVAFQPRPSNSIQAAPITTVIERAAADAAPPPPPPPSPPPPPTLEAAKGPKPKAPFGKMVVELRTEPPGMDVLLGPRRVGKSPLFLTIDANPKGSCSGGTCSGGKCSGGACIGGICGGGVCNNGQCSGAMCDGGICMGASCTGGTCTGATCPAGYRCSGARCEGGSCASATCSRTPCFGAVCAGTSCLGGPCSGGSCEGSCTGTCTGGVCEPVTRVRLLLRGESERVVEITPSDGDLLQVLPPR